MRADRLQNVFTMRWRTMAGVLLLGTVLGVRSWVVTPHLASLNAAQRYERATTNCIEKSRKLSYELRANQARLDKLTAEHDLLSALIFSPGEADEFLSSLGDLCRRSDCAVVSLRFMSARDQESGDGGAFVAAQGAALIIHGGYGNTTKLIEALQARREKVWIDGLHMTQSPSGSDQITCRMTITIYVDLHKEMAGYEHRPIHK